MAIREPSSHRADHATDTQVLHEYAGAVYRWAKLLSDRYWLAYLLVGLALMVVAAIGEVPKVGTISNVYFPIAFMVVGIILVAWSGMLVWLALTEHPRNEIDQSRTIDPGDYGLTFDPKTPSTVTPPYNIKGTLKKALPEQWELWLVNYSDYYREYWPRRPVVYVRGSSRKAWEVTFNKSIYKDGDTRTLLMLLVGPDGQALISCFRRINKELATPPGRADVGINALTSDMFPLGQPLYLKLKKPVSAP